MAIHNTRCLLLNLDYSPMTIIGWQRALVWSIKHQNDLRYGIEIIDFYKNDHIQGANNKRYPVPAVAKTKKFFKKQNNTVIFSRKNIYIRDNYTCQYCNIKFDSKDLTYDHVIPKSMWKDANRSPTNWTNITTACTKCNRKKGNRTPKQANMPIKNFPCMPDKTHKYLPISHLLSKIKHELPEEWLPYLPESYII
jgi:hypothetical protein